MSILPVFLFPCSKKDIDVFEGCRFVEITFLSESTCLSDDSLDTMYDSVVCIELSFVSKALLLLFRNIADLQTVSVELLSSVINKTCYM